MGYPIILEIRDKPVVVVGGGQVATRKAARLLAEGARVAIVSPEATPAVQEWDRAGKLVWHRRPYKTSDLEGALLVFAATDNPEVNQLVSADASTRGIWVNVADDAARSSFIVPATCSFGELRIAIDTGGGSPALSRALRMHLQETLSPGWGRGATVISLLRPYVKTLADEATRRRFWRALVASLPQSAQDEQDITAWIEGAARDAGLSLDLTQVVPLVRNAIETHDRQLHSSDAGEESG